MVPSGEPGGGRVVFNSLDFAIFFALLLPLAWALPLRARNGLLLLASYLFYAVWDWRFLGLLLLSTAIDYGVGLALDREDDPRRRRLWLGLSLTSNFGILGTFKYLDFFADSLQALCAALGFELRAFDLGIALPVGISFYTFQAVSYSIDVYRRRLSAERDPVDFALFVAFFPQLVAGPIERATHLLPQFKRKSRPGWSALGSGCWLMFWGLFKKVVIADNLAQLVDGVYAPGARVSGAEVLLATHAFAFQIYCDFSGYTDVARGSARLLGFDLMRNFDLPYRSASPSEFWRRWHISLSTWLRDYLYIELGGNRGSARRTRRNLLLTMLLGGLWHGAAWTFVAWGAFHGLWLVLHRMLEPSLARLEPRGGAAARVWRLLCVLTTYHGICFGWMLFRADSLGQVVGLLATCAQPGFWGRTGDWLLPFAALLAPLWAMQWAQARSGDPDVIFRAPAPLRSAIYGLFFVWAVLLGEDFGAPFIYFQF